MMEYNAYMERMNPYKSLMYAIILNAYEENDIAWLKSNNCRYYCTWLDFPHEEVLMSCEDAIKTNQICPICHKTFINFGQLLHKGNGIRRKCRECKEASFQITREKNRLRKLLKRKESTILKRKNPS